MFCLQKAKSTERASALLAAKQGLEQNALEESRQGRVGAWRDTRLSPSGGRVEWGGTVAFHVPQVYRSHLFLFLQGMGSETDREGAQEKFLFAEEEKLLLSDKAPRLLKCSIWGCAVIEPRVPACPLVLIHPISVPHAVSSTVRHSFHQPMGDVGRQVRAFSPTR